MSIKNKYVDLKSKNENKSDYTTNYQFKSINLELKSCLKNY